jgi:hypothetical protein
MPYLMHLAFDNARRLSRNVYYFQYQGIRFKLVQNNPRKWSDVLLTVIAQDDDAAARQAAFGAAGEWLSALSWHNSSAVTLRHIGGNGIGARFRLRQARCRSFVFPKLPFQGNVTGYGISQIAHIRTDPQRVALTLYREALSSNNDLLSFLCFWQVLEVQNGDAVGWVNRMQARRPQGLRLNAQDILALPLGRRRLGEYLQDDCRHAIAHIRRTPGRAALRFDNEDEVRRLAISTGIVRELARYYVRTQLDVTGTLHLVRPFTGGFPRYVDEAYLQDHRMRAVD